MVSQDHALLLSFVRGVSGRGRVGIDSGVLMAGPWSGDNVTENDGDKCANCVKKDYPKLSLLLTLNMLVRPWFYL